MTRQRAIVELLFADLFWGFSFVAIPLAHKTWNSSNIAFLRFAIPVLVGLFFSLFIKQWRLSSREFRLGIAPGFLFAATIYSQTLGLEYTSPSKSSFITVLYVLFVPLLETFLHKKKLPLSFWFSLLGALIGLALLFDLSWDSWNTGDTLTFICSLFATWHIHLVSEGSRRSRHPYLFNFAQCSWASVFLLPLALMSHQPLLPELIHSESIFGLAMIAIGATTIAFSIQARAQPYLSLSTSSVLFLFESPLAMFFSWLVLNEPIGSMQIMGGAIMLISCIGAVRFSSISV